MILIVITIDGGVDCHWWWWGWWWRWWWLRSRFSDALLVCIAILRNRSTTPPPSGGFWSELRWTGMAITSSPLLLQERTFLTLYWFIGIDTDLYEFWFRYWWVWLILDVIVCLLVDWFVVCLFDWLLNHCTFLLPSVIEETVFGE